MMTLESLLGPGGPLAQNLAGYELRKEQLAMAQAVEHALTERRYLLAEAGTGTGKTLAYLVPAALSGRKVVVSTATKNLQEQIFFKDIPLVRRVLGLELDACYLKGRSNYLCIERFTRFDAAPTLGSRDEVERWPALRQWALTTQTGDRAEADLPDGFLAWADLSTTAHTCLGTRCGHYDACFVTQARRRAEKAQLVVVNHALFFADLAIRSARGEGVLPPYEAVIFDEAHAVEDAATDNLGTQVSSYRLDELSRDAQAVLEAGDPRAGLLSALALKVAGVAEAFFAATARSLGLSRAGSVRLTSQSLAPVSAEAEALAQSLGAMGAYAASQGGEQGSAPQAAPGEPQLAQIRRRCDELAEELDFILMAEAEGHVFWAEQRGRGVFLKTAPVDVAEVLQQKLYRGVDTAVFTSATLTTQGSFDYFQRRLGLEAVARVSVPSPFDYRRQAALYTPATVPEPNAPGFVAAVADEIVALAEITGGRAFALFTSLRNMEAAWERAKGRLPYQVLLQGERPKTALLEAFRERPSVLFASQSFWEGVDVPGEALSLVVIDKLPFAPPGDPVVAARMDQLAAQGGDPFSAFQLPAAALALRQGFGRLIRTRTDRGIVAILDRRLTTKAYGRVFLQSLPDAWRAADRTQLKEWFTARGT